MCRCVCRYEYACACIGTSMCVYACLCIGICVCVSTRVFTCIHRNMHVHVCSCVRMNVYVGTRVCVCVCVITLPHTGVGLSPTGLEPSVGCLLLLGPK